MKEHTSAHRRRDSKSPMFKHDVNHHGEVEREGRYEAEIVSTHRHNLGRLVKEGSIILEATNFLGQDRVLNSRA